MQHLISSLVSRSLLLACGMLIAWVPVEAVAQDAAAEEAGFSAAETARLKQYLPRTLPKLLRRYRVRVAVLGDSISNFYTPAADCYQIEKAHHQVFLKRLAERFFFSGGVRNAFAKNDAPPLHSLDEVMEHPPALPPRGEVPPLQARIEGGPEILVYNHARDGATAIQALQPLTTDAFDSDPDLVIFMFGTNDANSNAPVPAFRQVLESVIALCQAHQADLIVLGPPLIFGTPVQLARTRPFARAARQAAGKAGVLFVDAGAALGRAPLEAPPDEKQALPHFIGEVEKYYLHEGKPDALHPNAAGHEVIARTVWENLFAGEAEDPFRPTAGLLLADAPAKFPSLLLTLHEPPAPVLPPAAVPDPLKQPGTASAPEKNQPAASEPPKNAPKTPADGKPPAPPAEKEAEPAVSGVVLSLLPVDNQWQITGDPTFQVKGFTGRRTMRLTLGPLAANGTNAFCGEAATVSFVIHEGATARLVDVDAGVLPIAMEIPTGRQEGVAGDISLDCSLINLEQDPFRGTATVEWLGKSFDLEVGVEAKSTKQLRLRVPLPADAPTPLREQLKVTLKSGERQFLFLRTIEATRNLSLGEKRPLAPGIRLSLAGQPELQEKAAGQFIPTLTVKADAVGLYATFELPPLPEKRSETLPSATVAFAIDARGPGERGKPGFVDLLSADVPWQDGPIPLRKAHAAIFGNGYDRELDPAHFRASVTTEAGGRRLVHLDIPRNYFYLHQWSLAEAGQNTLGLNASVSLIAFSAEQPAGFYAPENSWELSRSNFPRRDTSSLSVLELRSKSSGAWTVRIF